MKTNRRRNALLPTRLRLREVALIEPLEARISPATFLVTNVSDGGAGSLRNAIIQANGTANAGGPDQIIFNIGSATTVIQPLTPLPEITEAVIIDGYSQPGTIPNSANTGTNAVLRVELDGSLQSGGNGLTLGGTGGSIVRGLVVRGFNPGINDNGSGILIRSDNNLVLGNFLGTDVTGMLDFGNANSGVTVGLIIGSDTFTGNVIGGINPAERNLISGNSIGVRLLDDSVGTQIFGNLIGTNRTGGDPIPNTNVGIGVGGDGTVIGVGAPSGGNVISGNGGWGINVGGANTTIQGNIIGLNAAGTGPLGNGRAGVNFSNGATGGTVGGTNPGERNIISGNSEWGIEVGSNFGDGPGNNITIQGNFIGTDASGSLALGNAFDGIGVFGTNNTQIGGTGPGQANVIVFNGGRGVLLSEAAGPISNVRISGNSIHSNARLGIDLEGGEQDAFGVNKNDTLDADSGPNGLANAPVLMFFNNSGVSVVVGGTLNAAPGQTYLIEVFAITPAQLDLSGRGEGAVYLGTQSVSTDPTGAAPINFSASIGGLPADTRFTATATNLITGETSEFSNAVGQSTIFTWTGGISGDWYNAQNWTPTGVPGALDTANYNAGVNPIDLQAPASVAVFNHGAGLLTGSSTLNILQNWSWTGGDHNGPNVLLNTGATATLGGGVPLKWDSGTLDFYGAGAVTGAGLSFNDGLFNVTGPTGQLVLQAGINDVDGAVTLSTLSNSGNVTKAGPGNFGLLLGSVENSGLIQSQQGQLQLGGFIQFSGELRLAGGDVGALSPLMFDGGFLSGTGVIDAEVINGGGTVQPGGPGAAGTLNVLGDYTQGVDAVLEIDIAGTSPGTQYDQLVVADTAALDNDLAVNFLAGFIPAGGQTFNIVTGNPVTGTFNTVAGAGTLTPNYTATAAQLVSLAPVHVWDGSASSDWFDPNNWTPLGVPGPSDTAILDSDIVPNQPALSASATVAIFQQSAGTLGGIANLTITTNFLWSGGVQTGIGSTIVPLGATFSLAGAPGKTLNQRRLLLSGDSLVTGEGTLTAGNGALISNSGTFEIQSDADFFLSAGAANFVNQTGATFLRTTGGDTVEFQTGFSFQNNGSIEVESGRVSLRGGSGNAGTYSSISGAQLFLELGTYTLLGGATFRGGGDIAIIDGTVSLPGGGIVMDAGTELDIDGTVTIDGAFAVDPGARLSMRSAGTLTGAGNVSIAGELFWVGGTITGTGVFGVAAGGQLTLPDSGGRVLDGRTLNVNGIGFWSGGNVTLANGAAINVFAAFDVSTGDDFVAGPGGGSVNVAPSGHFTRVGGFGSLEVPAGIAFNNSGEVRVQIGGLDLGGGGSGSAGVFRADPGAQVTFTGGTHTLGGATTFDSGGTFRVLGGTVNLANGSTVSTTNTLVNVEGGTLALSGTVTANAGTTVALAGGIIGGTGTLTLGGATLTGAGTIIGNLANPSGSVRPGGTGAAGTINIGGSYTQGAGGTLFAELGGTGAGQFDVLATGTTTLGGTLNLAHISGFTPGGGQTFRVITSGGNPGTFATLTGATSGKSQVADPTGLVISQAGLTYIWDAGGVADTSWFNPLNWNFDSGVPGAGDTAVLNINSTISLPANTSVGTFQQSAGFLQPSAGVVLTVQNLNWNGGSMTGAGSGNILGTATISGAAGKTLNFGFTLTSNTTANLSGNGTLLLDNSSTFVNNGVFNVGDESDIGGGGTAALFVNAGTFNKTGAGTTTTLSRTFNHSGTINLSGGTLAIAGGGTGTGTFTVPPDTMLDFGGDYTLNAGSSITGSGPVRFTGGTVDFNAGTYSPFATVIAGGTLNLNVAASTVVLNQSSGFRGGTGTLTVSGPITWTGGSMTGTGTTISNGGLTISGVAGKTLNFGHTFVANTTTNLSGGGTLLLDNASLFDNNSTFNVTDDSDIGGGGTPAAFNNDGTFNKNGSGTSTTFTRILNNQGTVNVDGGTLFVAGGGNNTGGTFAVDAGTTLDITNYTLAATTTLSGAGTTRISAGTLTISGNTTAQNLAFDGGTINGTGSLTVNGTLDWTNGSMTDAGSTTIGATGTLNLSGAGSKTLNFSRTLVNNGTTNFSGGTLFLDNSSLFTNNGVFNATDDADLGGGGAAATFANAGTFNKTGVGTTTTFSRTFVNSGTVNATSGTLDFTGATYTQTAGALVLAGGNLGGGITFAFQGGELRGAGTITGSVNNTGATVRPGGTGAAGTLTISGGYTQGPGGTLAAELGGTGAGQFDVLATGTATLGGTLNIVNLAGFTPAGGDSFRVVQSGNNPGTFASLTGATAGLTPSSDAVGLVLNAGALTYTWDAGAGADTNWFNPLNWSPDGVPGAGDIAVLNTAATITLNTTNTSVATFNQSVGTLTGNATLTTLNSLLWSGGAQTGSGTTIIPAGSQLQISGTLDKTIGAGRIFVLGGNTAITGTGDVILDGTINNSAIFDLQSDADVFGTGGTFNNAAIGTLRKSAGASQFGQGATTLNNAGGTIEVLAGSLTATYGGTGNDGTYRAAGGTSLLLGFATQAITLSGAPNFTGGGNILVQGPTLTLTGAATITGAGTSFTLGNATLSVSGSLTTGPGTAFTQSSGTLNGSGNVTLNGTMTWSGGTIAGAGSTMLGVTSIDGAADKTLDGRTVTLLGTTTWTGTGNLVTLNGGVIDNPAGAVFDVQTDADFTYGGAGARLAFNNAGTLRKSAGAGTTSLDGTLANSAMLNVQTGTLDLLGTSTGTTATFAIDAGATLRFGAAYTGAGLTTVNGPGSTTIDAAWTAGGGATFTANANVAANAALTLNAASSVANGATLTLGSNVNGGGGLTVAGAMVWNSGTIGTALTIAPTGLVTVASAGAHTYSSGGASLDNQGTLRFTGTGPLSFINGSQMVNAGLVDFQSDSGVNRTGGPAIIDNLATGIIRKSAGAGATQLFGTGPAVTNVGTIEALSGTLQLSGGVVTSSGALVLAGGSLNGAFDLNASGQLRGTGTITGTVTNAGTVRPGGSGTAGTITITGDYTQTTGALELELGGVAAGQFDVLNVGGNATLGGLLNVPLLGAFTPPQPSSYTVMNFSSSAGNFTTTNLPPALTPSLQATAFVLSAAAPPNPLEVNTALDLIDPTDAFTSLREAITFANTNAGADTITFNIPGAGVQTIAVGSSGLGALPALTETTVLDATTQPGYAAAPLVELSGTNAGASARGLLINVPAVASEVRGFIIGGFTAHGIEVAGDDAIIADNFIGTNATGTVANANSFNGVVVTADGAQITGNLISANGERGVLLLGSNNIVAGNLIGTDVTGLLALGNGFDGLTIAAPGSGNLIGGTTSADRNVISGNAVSGVSIESIDPLDGFANMNRVIGNYIGVATDGITPLGNRAALGQPGWGVAILRQADGNIIGGTGAGESNVIAFNDGPGVAVAENARGNAVLGNAIFQNDGLGLDLGDDGPTANDADDSDTGANDLINFPVLAQVFTTATGATAIGSFTVASSGAVRIEFFLADGGEGRTFLGSTVVTGGGGTAASFVAALTGTVNVGDFIVATTSDLTASGSGTSEFSAPTVVQPPAVVSISDAIVVEGDSGTKQLVFRLALDRAVPLPVTVNFNTQDFTATAGADYTSQTGVATFAANALSQTITIAAQGDTVGEFRERFRLLLSGPTNADLAATEAFGIIADDDHDRIAAGDGGGNSIVVSQLTSTGAQNIATIAAFQEGYKGGVRVATGDVTGDGIDDVIAGAGLGGRARVRVFDGVTFEPVAGALGDLASFGSAYRGGVFVAAGDVNGDGHADVIVSPSAGSSNRVRVFDGATGALLSDFRAFGKGTAGVRVAAGDVNGDGLDDVIAGTGAGSAVRIFDALAGALLPGVDNAFRAFPKTYKGGIFVSADDMNLDGRDDVIVGAAAASAEVRVFDGGPMQSFDAYRGALRGVRLTSLDVTGDGIAEVIAAQGRKGTGKVQVFAGTDLDSLFDFAPFGKEKDGIYLG